MLIQQCWATNPACSPSSHRPASPHHPAPPGTAPTGDATALPVNPFTAQKPAAPVTPPAPTDMELAHAALICGYTAKDAPRQMTDADLARYFGVSTNIIGARPDAFYRRWVIATTRAALPGSNAVCRAILNDPHGAGQIVPDVHKLIDLENTFRKATQPEKRPLLEDGWVGVENSVLNILGAAIKGDLMPSAIAMQGSKIGLGIGAQITGNDVPAVPRIPLVSDVQDYVNGIGAHLQRRAAEPEHTPNRWTGMMTSGLTFAPFWEATPFVMGAVTASAEKQQLEDHGVDPLTAAIAGGLNGLILGAAQKFLPGNLKWGEGVAPWLQSLGSTTAKAAVAGYAQSAARNTATALTLHAGGYPALGNQYWARIPADARDSALFMLGFHLGGQGLRLTAGKADAARRNASTAPESQDAHASPNAPHGDAAPAETPAPQDAPSLEQARAALAEGARASDAVQAHDTLVDIGSQAQRTAMSKNNPALLKQVVRGMADSSPLKDFYVDGEALAPVLEKSGISPEEMEAILPGLNDTISPNDSLRVPVEALAAHPFLKEVLPNARIEPGAMSHAEAQALVGWHAENIERHVENAAAANHTGTSENALEAKEQIGRQKAEATESNTLREASIDGDALSNSTPIRSPVHGFASLKDFQDFSSTLKSGLDKLGFGDVKAFMHGSSVTGKRYKTGEPFNSDSDLDIALAGQSIFNKARGLGIELCSKRARTGPLSKNQIEQLGLKELRAKLQNQVGRDVNFMIYIDAETAGRRGPSVPIK
jgi:hypothetical protein